MAKHGLKVWARDTLIRALEQYEAHGVPRREALRKIMDKWIELALAGNLTAIKEIVERLDGKAAQALSFQDPDGNPLSSTVTDLELARRWAFLAEQAARAKEEEETRH